MRVLVVAVLMMSCSPFSYGWTAGGELSWSPIPMADDEILAARDEGFGGYLPSATPWVRNDSGQGLDCWVGGEALAVAAGETLEVTADPCPVQREDGHFGVACVPAGDDEPADFEAAVGGARWFYVCD